MDLHDGRDECHGDALPSERTHGCSDTLDAYVSHCSVNTYFMRAGEIIRMYVSICIYISLWMCVFTCYFDVSLLVTNLQIHSPLTMLYCLRVYM